MLSARVAQYSRHVASTSALPAAFLHTTPAVRAASVKSKTSNIERRANRADLAGLNKPHVILGFRQGDDAKWTNCDLAKVMVTGEEIQSSPTPTLSINSSKIEQPTYLNFGVSEAEKDLLFNTLPALRTEALAVLNQKAKGTSQPAFLDKVGIATEKVEAYKANMLARVMDLRNANARGIAFENRRRCVAAFSDPEKPNDTGRPEVQAAILTLRIRTLWAHLTRCRRDTINRRNLRQLVHQRAKILKYLKRIDSDRYYAVLERLGLEPESVEGELVV